MPWLRPGYLQIAGQATRWLLWLMSAFALTRVLLLRGVLLVLLPRRFIMQTVQYNLQIYSETCHYYLGPKLVLRELQHTDHPWLSAFMAYNAGFG